MMMHLCAARKTKEGTRCADVAARFVYVYGVDLLARVGNMLDLNAKLNEQRVISVAAKALLDANLFCTRRAKHADVINNSVVNSPFGNELNLPSRPD